MIPLRPRAWLTSLTATAIGLAAAMALVEAWVRWSWDETRGTPRCPSGSIAGPQGAENLQRDPQWPTFVSAVRDLRALHTRGQLPLVFFLNMAPPTCPDGDFYYDGGIRHVNQVFLDLLGHGVPAVSPVEAFSPLRPSQTPQAAGHSLGNANRVKADVLFVYLRDHVLPPMLSR